MYEKMYSLGKATGLFIERGIIMTNSLKAVKKATASPSKAELILTDSDKLALASVTGEASKAFDLFAKQQDASVAYDTAEQALTDDLFSYVHEAQPDYANWQAIKKHIITSVANSKGRKFETIEKWFNSYIVKGLKALGYELPKAESKSAQGMATLRAELASLSDSDIVTQIATLAQAGDKDSLKRATQLASEKQKREKQTENAIKKADSKATTELKGALKKWVTGLDHEQLVALVWAKNHFAQVTKLSKS